MATEGEKVEELVASDGETEGKSANAAIPVKEPLTKEAKASLSTSEVDDLVGKFVSINSKTF